MEGALVWLIDALVVLGVILLGISVFGMLWLPDLYTRLHAASKGCFVGTSLIVLAALVSGEPGMISHGLLILAFLVLTTPISAHAIGRAAWLAREPMEQEDKLDESGRLSGESCDRPADRDSEPGRPGRAESRPCPPGR